MSKSPGYTPPPLPLTRVIFGVILHLLRRVTPLVWVLKLEYRCRKGKRLDLKHPKTFNEKTQWLKAYWRDPLLVRCGDKYEVREFVRERGCGDLLNDLYGVYDRVEEIDPAALPDSFVIRCTHASGWNVIIVDKSRLDWEQTARQLRLWLAQDFGDRSGEWHYGRMKPRLVCERYLGDEMGKPPMDYKIFCFDSEPYMILVDDDRFAGHKRNIYDTNWNRINLETKFPAIPREISRPEMLATLLDAARRLSAGFCFVRVDLYAVGARVYFGELTFFQSGGFAAFRPEEYDRLLGDLLHLPERVRPLAR